MADPGCRDESHLERGEGMRRAGVNDASGGASVLNLAAASKGAHAGEALPLEHRERRAGAAHALWR